MFGGGGGGGVSGERQLKTVRTDAGESTVGAGRAEPQQNRGARSIKTKVA